ncbi:MAG: transglutaminase domain-containing protein, partial [Eubacteriales bacterium]
VLGLLLVLLSVPAVAKSLKIVWYNPYYDHLASINLPKGDRVDTYFTMQGTVNSKYTAVLVRTVYNKDEVYYYYPVNKNSVEGQVYLRFGQGTYQVEVNLVKPNPKNPGKILFDKLAKTELQNTQITNQRYLLPSWGVESENLLIRGKAAEITKDIGDNYLKVRAIHDWVSKNISYDMEKYNQKKFFDNQGALKTLQNKKGLCGDYASLTTALCRAVGIDAKIVVGQVSSNSDWNGHAWNEIKVSDRWVIVDTGWDSGFVKDNKFIPYFRTTNFDPSSSEFYKTHRKIQEKY